MNCLGEFLSLTYYAYTNLNFGKVAIHERYIGLLINYIVLKIGHRDAIEIWDLNHSALCYSPL